MVTITVETDPALARFRLIVAGATTDTITVKRIGADNEPVPVRSAENVPTLGGIWTGYDYEAPLAQDVRFTVYDDSGTPVADSAPARLDTARSWLKAPHLPLLNVIVQLTEQPKLERAKPQGVLRVLGRADPIVVSGARQRATGTVTFLTATRDADQALGDLLDTASVALLQVPHSRFGTRYIALGDVTEEPVSRLHADPLVRWTVAFTEVARPSGGLDGDPTASYQSLYGAYDSYARLRDDKDDYLDVLRGVGEPVLPPNPGGV